MGTAAIRVKGLWKKFLIPHEKRNTVFEKIASFLEVGKGYEELVALRGISFEVEKGDFIGVVGDNGSGKTTLLKIIANILRPSSGTVKASGRITSFLELGVGFQQDLTAKENIFLYGAIMGLEEREVASKLEEILEFSGLKKFEDAKLKNLSSGMQVRLAFSTAIQTNPEILLVDEVLSVGDMEFQQKCFDVFRKFQSEKKTIIYVSHDLNSVRRFCNKVLLLRNGEQVAFGKTDEVVDKYIYGVGKKEEQPAVQPEKQEEQAKEQRKQEQEQKEPERKKEQTGRLGNRLAEITGVRFLNREGKECSSFKSGDPVKVEISYLCKERVERPMFGVAVYDETGKYLFGTNTEIQDVRMESIDKSGRILLEIQSLPFLQGRIFWSFGIRSAKDHDLIYDRRDKEFSIVMRKSTGDTGQIYMQSRWRPAR